MDPEVPKPAGWYADPERPGQLRYWNGAMWGQQWKGWKPTEVQGPARQQRPLGRGFQTLGLVVSIGLQLMVPVFLGHIALFLWGNSMFDTAVDNRDFDRLQRFDDIDTALSRTSLVLVLATGISWMIWQYKLAKSADPSEIRYGAGWHAWGWVVPLANLVIPFQCVRALWRRRFAEKRISLLGWWWAAWVGAAVLSRIYAAQVQDPEPGITVAGVLHKFHAAVATGIVYCAVALVAVVLAVMVQRALTRAELPGAATPEASPAA